MSLIVLHTADWQLGKPFASVRDEAKRHRLQHERLEAIRTIGRLARESGAALVLVAGDVFDSPQVTKGTVSAACAAIGEIGLPVIAIPGNHDHGGPGSLWEQDFFRREREALAPNLTVLLKPEPLVLEQAVILPAPLLRRHSPGDVTGWIRQAVQEPSFPAHLPRIALVHGSVEGFGSSTDEDEEAAANNWIDLPKLAAADLDYIALGDWHGVKKVADKAWYSGTPETDRFPRGEGNRPGHVLKVTIARGALPVVEELGSGRFGWQELSFRLAEDSQPELLSSRLDDLIGPAAGESLLKLELEGSLGYEAAAQQERLLESWEARLLRLKLDQRVTIAPSAEELEAMTLRAEDPLVAEVAKTLAAQVEQGGEDGEIARLALRELHRMLAEAAAL